MNVFIAILLFILLRNALVLMVGLRRIEEVRRRNIRAIDEGRYTLSMSDDYPDAWQHYPLFMIDLRKWTYRQFFPEVLS